MRLIALQGLDREKLQEEYNELEKKIAYYQRAAVQPGEAGAACSRRS